MKIYIVIDCGKGRIYADEKEINNLPQFLERIKNTMRMQSNFKIFATHEDNCYDNLLFENIVK